MNTICRIRRIDRVEYNWFRSVHRQIDRHCGMVLAAIQRFWEDGRGSLIR